MTKRLIQLTLLATLAVPALPAAARGRFETGRSLVQQRCASCLAMGWIWAPARLDPGKAPDLKLYAKTWSPAKVCTWMRRQTRKVQGPACYPGFIAERDRLAMLYYLYRRAQGPILAPKIERSVTFRPYQGKALKRTLAARRASVLRYHQNRRQLEKMRQLGRSRYGAPTLKKVKPTPRAPATGRPARRGGR